MMTKQERSADLEAKASIFTARGRELEEAGKKAQAERCFAKADAWLAKANKARGW